MSVRGERVDGTCSLGSASQVHKRRTRVGNARRVCQGVPPAQQFPTQSLRALPAVRYRQGWVLDNWPAGPAAPAGSLGASLGGTQALDDGQQRAAKVQRQVRPIGCQTGMEGERRRLPLRERDNEFRKGLVPNA